MIDTVVDAATSSGITLEQAKDYGQLTGWSLFVVFAFWMMRWLPRWRRENTARELAIDKRHSETTASMNARHDAAIAAANEQIRLLIESANARHERLLELISRESRADRDACDARSERIVSAVNAQVATVNAQIAVLHSRIDALGPRQLPGHAT